MKSNRTKAIRTKTMYAKTMAPIFACLLTVFSFVILSGSVTAEESVSYWIDVRSAEEYAEKHHPLAVNIPHTEIAARIGEVTDDKNADVHVYCRSGRRSGLAKEALEELGFTKVKNEGGINDVLGAQL